MCAREVKRNARALTRSLFLPSILNLFVFKMANSRLDYFKEQEKLNNQRYLSNTYIVIRVDGYKFHNYTSEHNFDKPNDKRALDLMGEAARQVILMFKGEIALAYGHSDEFSFLLKSTSNLYNRRREKIISMITSAFTAQYNSKWPQYFDSPQKIPALFDARTDEYARYKDAIDYFRWRQIDCHINNLYNTTLHAMTGRYVRHELNQGDVKKTPITDWIRDRFLPAKEATERLSGTVSSDKHDIMFLEYGINYNNELEQFKKGTILVPNPNDRSFIAKYHRDIIEDVTFWDSIASVFEDYSGKLDNNINK